MTWRPGRPPAKLTDWAECHMDADRVKRAVSEWARGMEFMPLVEIEGVAEGRLDLLLVPVGMKCPLWMAQRPTESPWHRDWTERCGLAGVEVKVAAGDFAKGLREQFARYAKNLCGLYVAGPPQVVKLKEVPEEFGVLHVGHRYEYGDVAVCRRHPKWSSQIQPSNNELWRVVWALERDYRRLQGEQRQEQHAFESKLKDHTGHVISRAIKASLECK